MMLTNLAIDDALLRKAVRVGGKGTKRATVNEALQEYIQRRKRLRAIKAFGTIKFDSVVERARRRR